MPNRHGQQTVHERSNDRGGSLQDRAAAPSLTGGASNIGPLNVRATVHMLAMTIGLVLAGILAALPAHAVAAVTQPADALLQGPNDFDNAAIADQAMLELQNSPKNYAGMNGFGQPGECVMAVLRWETNAGGPSFGSPASELDAYLGKATDVTGFTMRKGDVVQYTQTNAPGWNTGVHTVVVYEVNADGTLWIIQSNASGIDINGNAVSYATNPGVVTQVKRWTPSPPSGFTARVWRFGKVHSPVPSFAQGPVVLRETTSGNSYVVDAYGSRVGLST